MTEDTKIKIPGFNTLLLGQSGKGKTHALRTYIEAGLELFVLYTEPGLGVLGDLSCSDGYHYRYIPPATAPWSSLIDNADKINKLDLKALASMSGLNKKEYAQMIEVLRAMNNFTCDKCGKEFGDVAEWDASRAFALDSLSGLSIQAMDLVVGGKPVKSMSDWGIAMDNLNRVLQKLTTDTTCFFTLTAHIEPEKDEVTGRIENMPSTLGKKLAPVLPRFFDDVILCKNNQGKFTWSTSETNIALKSRNLGLSQTLAPSFVQLVNAWKKLNN